MKRRVRKTQRFTIWDKVMYRYREVVVKHDSVRPVKMMAAERIAVYTKQNGGDYLTPRQARRLRLKGGASSTPVRGRRTPAGSPSLVRNGLDWPSQ